jgi:hypothetical protein
MIVGLRNEKDVEGSGCDVMYGTIPAFAWRDWGKARSSSVTEVGVRAEI